MLTDLQLSELPVDGRPAEQLWSRMVNLICLQLLSRGGGVNL
jgi:hypothetical protein